MSQEQVTPFKIRIPDSELELLRKKLELARLPEYPADTAWGEEAEGGVTASLMRDTVQHWKTSYDWRAEEARLNMMPQFTVKVSITGFDPLTVHFVHARAAPSARDGGAIPLLFLHGWPGSFMEVQPMLPILLEAGFDVVAPSLPGFGFSSYPRQAGFNVTHHAEAFDLVMAKLGYSQYVVQGGDWGSTVGRALALLRPSRVKALHLNMLISRKVFGPTPPEKDLTEPEKVALGRWKWFSETGTAYQQVQKTKPRTLGYALHDSPVGMLSWMMDKLLLWSDRRSKKWTADEFITWTLLHYFPGPTSGMQMYRENMDPSVQAAASGFVTQPTGVSHFPDEILMAPQQWAEEECNIEKKFWRTHDVGGHFAAYEQPAALAADVIEFANAQWAK